MTAGMCRRIGSRKQSWKLSNNSGPPATRRKKVEGHWRHGGVVYCDELVKLVVDAADNVKNRRWMRAFKTRWKAKLEQLELWLASYSIDVD